MAELAGTDFQNLRVLLGHPWANELMGIGEGWARRLAGRVPGAKVGGERVDVRSIRLGAEFDEIEVTTEAGELRWVAVPDEAPVPPVLRGFLLGVAAERSAGLRVAARDAKAAGGPTLIGCRRCGTSYDPKAGHHCQAIGLGGRADG